MDKEKAVPRMSSKVMSERLLNTTAIIATACAIIAVGLRLREAFVANVDSPVTVREWQQLANRGITQGAERPSVTLVEFSDFQCPFCAKAFTYVDDLPRRFPQSVRTVYRHFPIHEFAAAAGIAAECANEQGRFRELERVLFVRRDSIGVKPWPSFAHDAGLTDSAAFERCIRDPAMQRRVTEDSIAAEKLHLTGTPSFLINDILITGFPGDSAMDHYIAEALRPTSMWHRMRLRVK